MTAHRSERDVMVESLWRTYLTTGEFEKERRQRHFFRLLPGSPRCKSCYAPFQGAGSLVVKLAYGKKPSNLNPQLCNACELFASQYQGGAESVGSKGGISDITVLGDTANTTARLTSSVLTGEILISDAAHSASGLDFGQAEKRYLELKGKSFPMSVRVLTNFS